METSYLINKVRKFFRYKGLGKVIISALYDSLITMAEVRLGSRAEKSSDLASCLRWTIGGKWPYPLVSQLRIGSGKFENMIICLEMVHQSLSAY